MINNTDIKIKVLKSVVNYILYLRHIARKNKKYEEADTIREILDEIGVVVQDTKHGLQWRWKAKGE